MPFAIMASLAAAVVVLWERSPFLTAVLLGPILAVALYQRSVGGVLARLRELDRMKDEFIAVVSHELRTPLASVYGAAVTLQHRQLDTRMQAEMLSIIHSQSDRLAALLDEVLLANRLESGREEMGVLSCDPADVAHEAVAAARAQLAVSPSKAPSVELLREPALPAVAAPADKLRRVLGNLIENAVKYSPEGGRIQVRLESAGDLLRVSVQDEGLGIAATELDRIFEKFYRVDPDQTHGVGGTGLGLYICRTLVEQMGGRISVVSEEGQGSTFVFELPFAESAQRAVDTPARPLIARAVDVARTRRPTPSTRSTTRSSSTGRLPPREPSAPRRRR
jgi:signal transduction histidine kinase